MRVAFHPEPGVKSFLRRTIAAQTHLLGAVAAVFGLFALLAEVPQGSSDYWACLVFGLSGILVFSASAVYHFLSDGFKISDKLIRVLDDIDHSAIYIFIAGSYTPFLLNSIRSAWQAPLLIAIWAIALIGLAYTHFKARLPVWAQHRYFYTGLFLLMGWAIVIRIEEIFEVLAPGPRNFLLLGAVAYSLGAAVYATQWPRLKPGWFGYHELWHVMVGVGFAFHYLMIYQFYA